MSKPTDDELIEEIRQRFEFNRNALSDLRAVTRKLEEMNEKLQASERVKSQFLSNIRNEINNPLMSIMGLSKQIVDKKADADTARMPASANSRIASAASSIDFTSTPRRSAHRSTLWSNRWQNWAVCSKCGWPRNCSRMSRSRPRWWKK